jgi:hypothetical protein
VVHLRKLGLDIGIDLRRDWVIIIRGKVWRNIFRLSGGMLSIQVLCTLGWRLASVM